MEAGWEGKMDGHEWWRGMCQVKWWHIHPFHPDRLSYCRSLCNSTGPMGIPFRPEPGLGTMTFLRCSTAFPV